MDIFITRLASYVAEYFKAHPWRATGEHLYGWITEGPYGPGQVQSSTMYTRRTFSFAEMVEHMLCIVYGCRNATDIVEPTSLRCQFHNPNHRAAYVERFGHTPEEFDRIRRSWR